MKKIIYFIYDKIFLFLEKYFQIHITRSNYYSPLVASKDLNDLVYEKEYEIKNLNFDVYKQINIIQKFKDNFFNDFLPIQNDGLSLVDTFVLYSFIRDTKPKKVVEIGYGASTGIILKGIKDDKLETDFYSIDPYPKKNQYNYSNKVKLIEKKVQDVSLEFFKDVDFLFIDSSHISKPGSDVNYEIFEILPILKKNTIIHWHDIFLPYNYPKFYLQNKNHNMYWNESYLVFTFLLYNLNFEILYAGNYLKNNYFNKLKKLYPYLSKQHMLSSFYIKKII